MTLQDLRYLVTLAETRNFARAAEACYVSQPTLSTQIKKLEDELGLALFERTNKRVMPTSAGSGLIVQARIVLEEAEKLQQMHSRRSIMAEHCGLGVISHVGSRICWPICIRNCGRITRNCGFYLGRN